MDMPACALRWISGIQLASLSLLRHRLQHPHAHARKLQTPPVPQGPRDRQGGGGEVRSRQVLAEYGSHCGGHHGQGDGFLDQQSPNVLQVEMAELGHHLEAAGLAPRGSAHLLGHAGQRPRPRRLRGPHLLVQRGQLHGDVQRQGRGDGERSQLDDGRRYHCGGLCVARSSVREADGRLQQTRRRGSVGHVPDGQRRRLEPALAAVRGLPRERRGGSRPELLQLGLRGHASGRVAWCDPGRPREPRVRQCVEPRRGRRDT
mmetsp:Transcript_73371/g.212530  ORF Transcript_73371/g.212530 Transcript_73371/m.212530 type:complete len:260 (+) Transcript_73371:734-1513(+)